MNCVTVEASEITALLQQELPSVICNNNESSYQGPTQYKSTLRVSTSGVRLLPISLFAALAMAATGASQVYTYATLLCRDPQHCQATEQHNFSGVVAAATSVANMCSLLALGSFEKVSRQSCKHGLVIWLVVRTMSVGALALGRELTSAVIMRMNCTHIMKQSSCKTSSWL